MMWDILKTNISFYVVAFFIAINIVTDKCDAQTTSTSMYDIILVSTTTSMPSSIINNSNNTLKNYNNFTNNLTNTANSTYDHNNNASIIETALPSSASPSRPINGWSEVCNLFCPAICEAGQYRNEDNLCTNCTPCHYYHKKADSIQEHHLMFEEKH